MRFIYFILLFAAGLGMIIYREKIQRFTGNIAFAEKWLGEGGTFNLYLFFGIFLIFISVAYVTGTLDTFISSTAGRFILVPGQ
ncbi:MAG: hypothetical protein Q8O95_05640 [bacterium]|nr:hypothetical protein [bacterium]